MGQNMGEEIVYIYANRLNVAHDAYDEISAGQNARREYVVDAYSVQQEDMSYEAVSDRVKGILLGCKGGETVKFVLAGYSPLVVVMHSAFKEACMYMLSEGTLKVEVEEVYYMRDLETKEFVEYKLY